VNTQRQLAVTHRRHLFVGPEAEDALGKGHRVEIGMAIRVLLSGTRLTGRGTGTINLYGSIAVASLLRFEK
jgi:hypothetical protein